MKVWGKFFFVVFLHLIHHGAFGTPDPDLYEYENGDVYKGEMKNHKFHGKGVHRYANGDVYEGEFKDGNMHGYGSYTVVKDDVYEGDFVNDMHYGKGVLRWANGDYHEGEFKDDLMHGNGVILYVGIGGLCKADAKGIKREGFWWKNKKHGKIIYTFTNGTTREELWDLDFCIDHQPKGFRQEL